MNIMNARLVQPNMTASLIVVIDACVLSAQCSKPVFTSCGRNSNRRGFPNPVNSLARLANGTSSPGGGKAEDGPSSKSTSKCLGAQDFAPQCDWLRP